MSTGKSYIDQATGMAQRAMGAVTGDSSQQIEGEATRTQAEQENLDSHTTAKLGPITADPNTGAVAHDNSQRATGSWDQTVGSAKESVGNMLGNEELRRAGVEQNARGKGVEAEGQLRDYGDGVQDRVKGGVGKAVAAATGDREQEEKWTKMHDEGKVLQRGAEADMQKRFG
ncbi:hypothetical protein FE257_002856 [Aspergillus nanangensis]|uniref:CsbD-like domain-containing protein n=1 Tax=Aspergillus nanangensis TaxID=2582783 RepID=A0AAD4CT03_ASPNN|nr:hypothetical protein FE257_002856 [Aspergillus nanangensis]